MVHISGPFKRTDFAYFAKVGLLPCYTDSGLLVDCLWSYVLVRSRSIRAPPKLNPMATLMLYQRRWHCMHTGGMPGTAAVFLQSTLTLFTLPMP
jgi:hypothetical protein